jgi:hypothetical protein
MKFFIKLIGVGLIFTVGFADEYEYTLQDYNTTSPTYGMDVWLPEYSNHITIHYFSTQG